MSAEAKNAAYVWRFFRAGGFDQVRIDRGSDIAHLDALDQKLWAALACPTKGVEFDERTLALIDSDHDGRIRVPELIDAIKWAVSVLESDSSLEQPGEDLALNAISARSENGAQIQVSAKLILDMLGKGGSGKISVQDAQDVEKIFSATPFNGDGIITLDSAGKDDEVRAALKDIIDYLGADEDRSHQPGVSQTRVDQFFAEANAFADWLKESGASRASLKALGENVDAGAALMDELRDKLDDYFARVNLAGVDPKAADALNPPLSVYETMANGMLKSDAAAIAALPIERVDARRPLQLKSGVNPAWSARLARFADEVVTPLLGPRDILAEQEWEGIKKQFADHRAWSARKPQTRVAQLGPERIQALLVPSVKQRIDALVARDKALEPQMNAIADVEKLLRLKRDLMPLLNNFASFRDFYTRTAKAVFQAGTLYLDNRSCDLCVKVENDAKHAEFATLSQIYLAYCRCTRVGGSEVMTIAAAFTAGDGKNLRVGRNGIFYDRKGRDWDAMIIRIIEHPISLRQAFWLPYRQFARFVGEQVQKVAAARAAAQQANMQAATIKATAAPAPATPAPAAPTQAAQQQQAFDVARFAGIFAAFGLAIGAIGTALVSITTGFLRLSWWQMPLVILGIILLISGPSVLIAWLKLQSRNLGPVLDACGWAVNTQLKINLPFGRSLTSTAVLPPGAERSISDPYAEKKSPWRVYLVIAVVIAALLSLWRLGLLQQWLGIK
ncbi:MAG TPA: hypothetical protein VEU06_00440 [Micropepsaceae bacterium]|nr:hypothetical protein [Micropepsaceae bacterium]